jgi:hypothetical protein
VVTQDTRALRDSLESLASLVSVDLLVYQDLTGHREMLVKWVYQASVVTRVSLAVLEPEDPQEKWANQDTLVLKVNLVAWALQAMSESPVCRDRSSPNTHPLVPREIWESPACPVSVAPKETEEDQDHPAYKDSLDPKDKLAWEDHLDCQDSKGCLASRVFRVSLVQRVIPGLLVTLVVVVVVAALRPIAVSSSLVTRRPQRLPNVLLARIQCGLVIPCSMYKGTAELLDRTWANQVAAYVASAQCLSCSAI